MTTLIIIIHLIVCIGLILIVLLQTGKGASLGAAFGGATQTVFGAAGSGGFFGKLTTGIAIVFMITSLSLSYLSLRRGGESIMKSPPAQEQKATQNAPQTPNAEEGQKASPSTTPAPNPSPSGTEGSK